MATKPMFLIYEGGKLNENVPPTPKVYGVSWDGSSTTEWTRTDDAADFPNPSPSYMSNGSYTTGSSPFDNIMPWSGMVVSERTGGTMVAIPKFWYKWTKNGNAMKIQVSNVEREGFSVSPAHMDRGLGEKDVVYIGRYHCGMNTYKSTTGVFPQNNLTRSDFRTSIHRLGTNIYQFDYACLITLWILYLVEFASWNSQEKIGGGCRPTNTSATVRMGYTDTMTYHTGTTASSISYTVFGGTQYRNIEGLWDNVRDWVDGIVFNNTNIYVIQDPSKFTDSTSSPAVKVGTRTASNYYPSNFTFSTVSGYTWFLYPSGSGGSYTTYISDYCNNSSSGTVLYFGGDYANNNGSCGLFSMYANSTSTGKGDTLGSRIVEYP